MDETWAKNYPSAEGITIEVLGENHSLAKMFNLIEENKRVVDFGCATGYLAKLLQEKGCVITGVDYNPEAAKIAEKYCQEVIVADLDFVSVTEILPNQEFDVVVFGDVLEHLRNPWKVLEDSKKILKPDGYVVASIPNIAHGAIRLALLQGKFEYAELGILDNTHLRFFTRETVEKLFDSSGYLLNAIERTKTDIFADTNVIPQINKSDFSADIINQITSDEEADTLQFIVQAFPATLEKRYALLNERHSKLIEESQGWQSQLQQTQVQLADSQTQLQQTQAQLADSQTQLQQTQARLEASQTQLQQTQAQLADSQNQQQQTQVRLEASQNQQQQTQDQQQKTQIQLKGCQSQLQSTKTELENTQFILQQTQAEKEQTHLILQQTQQQWGSAQTTIHAMETSKFWQLRTGWFKVRHSLGITDDNAPLIKSLFSSQKKSFSEAKVEVNNTSVTTSLITPAPPLESVPQTVTALPGNPQTDDICYQQWLNKNYPTQATLQRLADMVDIFSYKPVISLVMPVYNTPELYLREAIESVLHQVYPYWELCIADDASPDYRIREILEEYSVKDERIKVVYRSENGHISRCSNSALEIAIGEFIALFDHDDLLTPDALFEIALLLNKHPEADMIYSDEDKIDDSGKLKEPFFKPNWCPDSFLSRMYTCHLGVYRRSLVNSIGGFREGYEGSQDYDLVLRLTEKTKNIFHIPKILYHWRIHPESAACKPDQKPYAVLAAEKALTDALQRRGEPGRITQAANLVGHYVIRYEITHDKLVSIIIPTRDLGDTLDKCLTSIFENSVYSNYEVILIDNGSEEEYTAQVIAKWTSKEANRFRCYRLDIDFNYSRINNYAVEQAKGDYLLFLNNDIEVITPDWIDAMVEQAQRPCIGAIGALLLYPDNTIQHAGVVMGIGGVANHSHKHFSIDSPGYFGQIMTVNNYSAVTAACLMCRRDVFESVGGFEEELAVAFNDVDLCLKIVEKGYRNIYLPHVVLYHYESKSRGYEDTPEKQARFVKEVEYMQNKWKHFIAGDPCYNINLTKTREDYSMRI